MHILKNNKGVTLVFITFFLFLMMAFLGLVIDVGWTAYVRTQGQSRVDAAALAAASQLSSSTVAATRQSNAQTIANTFAGYNMVVDTSTNPANALTPMQYNYSAKTLATAADWTTANCNAVRVTNAVPTPLFFSGIRNFFGASETGSTDVNVNATAYVGCPGAGKPPLPLAFCHTSIGYPNNCNVVNGLQAPSTTDNSGFFTPPGMTANASNCSALVNGTTALPQIGVGDSININNGQLTSCLQDINTQYNAKKDATGKWCVAVPVFDGSCTAGNFNQSRSVVGYAEFCITEVVATGSPKYVRGQLLCPATWKSGSGGACFGLSASNPILVQ